MGDKIVSSLLRTKIMLSLTCSRKDDPYTYLQDNLAELRDQGEFVETGPYDILTEALDTHEHPVHVRTKGKYVT